MACNFLKRFENFNGVAEIGDDYISFKDTASADIVYNKIIGIIKNYDIDADVVIDYDRSNNKITVVNKEILGTIQGNEISTRTGDYAGTDSNIYGFSGRNRGIRPSGRRRRKSEAVFHVYWSSKYSNLIESLSVMAEEMKRRGETLNYIRTVRTIETLRKLATDSESSAKELIIRELRNIEYVLKYLEDLADKNPDVLITSGIKTRIQLLEDILWNTEGNVMYQHLLDNNSMVDINELADKLAGYRLRYEKLIKKAAKSILLNEPTVKESIKEGTVDEEELTEIVDTILAGLYDTDMLSKWTLGMQSGGTVIGQIFYSMVNSVFLKERGFISKYGIAMQDAWNKIKSKKSGGQFLWKKLIDNDGVSMRDIFRSKYYEDLAQASDLEKENTEAYKKFVNTNFEIFDIRKSAEIKRRFIEEFGEDHDFVKHYFKDASDEYDDKIKKSHGNTIYDIMVSDAINKVIEFTNAYNDINKGGFISREEVNTFADLNPFEHIAFLKGETNKITSGSFVTLMPKSIQHIDYVNQNFFGDTNIEEDDDLRDFYTKAYYILTHYVIPTFNASGGSLKRLALAVQPEIMLSEARKQKRLFKAITAKMKEALYKIVKLPFTVPESDTTIKQKAIYKNNPFYLHSLIIKMRTAKGMTEKQRNRLQDLYWNFDNNIFTAIQTSLEFASDLRYRKSAKIVYDIITDAFRITAKEKGEDTLPNLRRMFELWGMQNIMDIRFPQIQEEGSTGTINKVQKRALFNTKVYDNITEILNDISKEDNEFGKFAKEQLENKKRVFTIGTFMLGLVNYIVVKRLWLNPKSGVNNRSYGYLENKFIAASGRVGFNEEQYANSRRELVFTNTLKYLVKLVPGLRNTRKYKKMMTLRKFMESLQLIQNYRDVLAKEGRIISKYRGLYEKLLDSVVDFSINNPEWRNQAEVILSLMQNTFVYDKYGNKRPLYDASTGEFIWKAGTLELKDEFRTNENIRQWEKFEVDNANPQNLVFFNKALMAIHTTQGNYRNEDKVGYHYGMFSRSLALFSRYLPEAVRNRYSDRLIDLYNGEIGKKGRYTVLMRYTPVFFLYMFTRPFIDIVSAIMYDSIMRPWMLYKVVKVAVGTFAGTVPAAYAAWRVYKNRAEKESATLLDNIRLAINMSYEILIRSVALPIDYMTLSRVTIGDKIYEKIRSSSVRSIRTLTEEERKVLSEVAQEMAAKVNLLFTTYLFTSLLKILGEYTFGCASKKDKELSEDCKKRLKNLDNAVYTIINMRNNILADIDKYINIIEASNSGIPIIRELSNFHRLWFNKLPKRLEREEYGGFVYDFFRYSPLPVPYIPLKIYNGSFFDDRVWDIQNSDRMLDYLFDYDRETRVSKYYRGYKNAVYTKLKKKVGSLNIPDSEKEELLKTIKKVYTKKLNPRSHKKALSDFEKAKIVDVSKYYDNANNMDIKSVYAQWRKLKLMKEEYKEGKVSFKEYKEQYKVFRNMIIKEQEGVK